MNGKKIKNNKKRKSLPPFGGVTKPCVRAVHLNIIILSYLTPNLGPCKHWHCTRRRRHYNIWPCVRACVCARISACMLVCACACRRVHACACVCAFRCTNIHIYVCVCIYYTRSQRRVFVISLTGFSRTDPFIIGTRVDCSSNTGASSGIIGVCGADTAGKY